MSQRKTDWPKTKPVIVRWVDSMASPGWSAKSGAQFECITIGNLVEKTEERICVALNKSSYSDGDMMEIPRVAVRSVRRLKE